MNFEFKFYGQKSDYRKHIIFDRDETLVRDVGYVNKISDFLWILPVDVTSLVSNSKVNITVCSNQSGVGRGLYSKEEMWTFNDYLVNFAGNLNFYINAITCCIHNPEQNFICNCRKPRIEMIDFLIYHFGNSKADVLFVGDQNTDALAARNSGINFLNVKDSNISTSLMHWLDE